MVVVAGAAAAAVAAAVVVVHGVALVYFGVVFFNYIVVLHTMSPTLSPNQEPAVPQRPHDTALTLAHPYDFSEAYFNKAYRQNITRRKHNIARTSPRKHPSQKIPPTKSRQQKNTTPSQTCHAKKRDIQ